MALFFFSMRCSAYTLRRNSSLRCISPSQSDSCQCSIEQAIEFREDSGVYGNQQIKVRRMAGTNSLMLPLLDFWNCVWMLTEGICFVCTCIILHIHNSSSQVVRESDWFLDGCRISHRKNITISTFTL